MPQAEKDSTDRYLAMSYLLGTEKDSWLKRKKWNDKAIVKYL